MRKSGRRRHRLKLRQKILALFVVTWIITVFSISGVAISSQLRDSRHKEIQQDVANLSAGKLKMQALLEKVNLIGLRFSQNMDVRELMDNRFTMLEPAQQQSLLVSVGQLLYENTYVATFGTDTSMALFCEDGRIYSNIGMLLQAYDPASFPFCVQSPAALPYQDGHDFSVGRNTVFQDPRFTDAVQYQRVFRLRADQTGKGVIALLIQQSSIQQIFARPTIPAATAKTWLVAGADGIVFAASDTTLMGRSLTESLGIQAEQLQNGPGTLEGSLHGQKQYLTYDTDLQYGLYYFYATPMDYLLHSVQGIILSVAATALTSLLVLSYLAWYLSKRFTEPLDKLGNIMTQAEKGNLNVRMHPQFDDEIGIMGMHFDAMLSQLQQLIQDMQRIEQEKRKAELTILELQINPHFLYNTFSSIIWLAEADQPREIIDLTKSLAQFYRIALSNGQELIPVNDELTHVRNYIHILHYRYADELEVRYEIAPELLRFRMLKLLLQPLVENSIHHGTRLLENVTGCVVIRGTLSEGALCFEVRDNGQALDEAGAQALNQALAQHTGGVGTNNVNNRIQSHYGPKYGLSFAREAGWTIARITIPAQEDQT